MPPTFVKPVHCDAELPFSSGLTCMKLEYPSPPTPCPLGALCPLLNSDTTRTTACGLNEVCETSFNTKTGALAHGGKIATARSAERHFRATTTMCGDSGVRDLATWSCGSCESAVAKAICVMRRLRLGGCGAPSSDLAGLPSTSVFTSPSRMAELGAAIRMIVSPANAIKSERVTP
jgi:hypothetical protein